MKYFKLYKSYLSLAIKSKLEYKKDTILGIISFCISNTASILTIMFVVNSLPSLNGWTMMQLGFLYGFSLIPRAIDHLLSDSVWNLGMNYITRGELDRFLVRPVNVLFQMIAEVFQPEALGELLLGLILTITCGIYANITITFSKVLLMIVATIFGAILYLSIKLITATIAFWTKRSIQVMTGVYNLSEFARYPISIYHIVIQAFLTFIIPFGLIVSIPVEVVVQDTYNCWPLMGIIVLVSSLFFIFALLFFKLGLKKYESAGN